MIVGLAYLDFANHRLIGRCFVDLDLADLLTIDCHSIVADQRTADCHRPAVDHPDLVAFAVPV